MNMGPPDDAKRKKYERIADRIEHEYARPGQTLLPGINELAAGYAVSYRTMWKALQELKRRGVVAISQGKQAVMNPTAPHPSAAIPGPTVRMLIDAVTAGIARGTWKRGRLLPKISYFTLTFNTGHSSVVRALRYCAAEGLVYRKGKRWCAGPPPDQRSRISSHRVSIHGENPVIACLLPRLGSWYWATAVSFASLFCRTLKSETEKYGIAMAPATIQPEETGLPLASGIGEITRLVDSLGKRYHGSLLMITTRIAEQLPVKQLILALLRHEKPFIWFDTMNEEALRTQLCSSIRNRAGQTSHLFHYCSHNGREAVRIAIETLAGLGHRRIGIPVPFRREWIDIRLAMLRREAERTGVTLEVAYDEVTFPCVSPDARVQWRESSDIFQALRRVTGFPPPGRAFDLEPPFDRRRARAVIAKSRSLFRLIHTHKVTALIALCDYFAQDLYGWLRIATIPVPEQISLLSFDNRVETQIYPISTIDYGLDTLGYRAAHIYIGDIRISTDDRRNGVYGDVSLIDRGSLGPAPHSVYG